MRYKRQTYRHNADFIIADTILISIIVDNGVHIKPITFAIA